MSNSACPFKDFIEATADPATGDALVEDFMADPITVGVQRGLSEAQIIILIQGKPNKIRQELEREGCMGDLKWSPFGLMT